MQLIKTFFVFSISLFPLLSSLSLAKAETSPSASIIERTTVPGENLCKTQTHKERTNSKLSTQRIELHYIRDAANMRNMLQGIKDKLGMEYLEIYHPNDTEEFKVARGDEMEKPEDDRSNVEVNHPNNIDNEIILFGPKKERQCAYRIIAALDLPQPGINMQMWGIQISSKNPDELADVMAEVSEEISHTQQLVKETYSLIQAYAATEIKDDDFEDAFQTLLVNEKPSLGYKSALSSNRPLSLIDIILRLVAAETPSKQITQDIANKLTKEICNDNRYKYYLEQFRGDDELQEVEPDQSNKEQQELSRLPFERFFSFRGLEPNNSHHCADENKSSSQNDLDFWKEKRIDDNKKSVSVADKYAEVSRKAVLDFALEYARFVSEPDKFNPYAFQQSTDVLNNRLQDTVNALNRDIEDLFVRPTLNKIQEIVSDYDDVEYAQVGRTSVASLSGMTTNIESDSFSVFDRTPPLSLPELLGNVTELSPQTSTSLPVSTVVNLLTAYENQQRINQTVKTGVTLNITPNVLRNMSSAELAIDLTLADPVASSTQAQGVPELSRIGQQKVKTTVYTDPVDFFAFSTFSNQSTLDGGRSYVPVVGTVWRGVFGSVPVLGDLFSWKNSPQDVLHESLLLTNTFIAPTALGLGLLYPIEETENTGKSEFCVLKEQIQEYPRNVDQINADLVEKCEKNHETQ